MALWPWMCQYFCSWFTTAPKGVSLTRRLGTTLRLYFTSSEFRRISPWLLGFQNFIHRIFLILPECAINVMGTIWMFCGLVPCINPKDSFANTSIECEFWSIWTAENDRERVKLLRNVEGSSNYLFFSSEFSISLESRWCFPATQQREAC
jgi:hypothetical protein